MLIKQKPLTLSVIIPVFNEENYLDDCLRAISNQTVLPDEVIVVDNNSTDNSVKIAKKYSFVRVIKETQQGIDYARNKGFSSSASTLLGRIDSDTILAENWVETVLSHYKKRTDFVLTGSSHYRNLKMPANSTKFIDFTYYSFSRLLLGHHTLFGSNMVIPRSLWNEVSDIVCLGSKYHEDTDLSVHLAKNTKIVKSSQLVASVAFRIGEKPGGLSKYIIRWLNTVQHSWQVNSLSDYSFFIQLKNIFLTSKD